MPLFRSHNASGNATSRRTDFERQIGCIAGFFQIFDQQQRKQITGPRKGAALLENRPPAAENSTSSNYESEEDHSSTNDTNQCPDAKVVGADDNGALTDTSAGDSEMQGLAATQSTNASNGHGALANQRQQEKLHRLKTSQAREELHNVRETMRHRSFNLSRDRDEEIAFSPHTGNVGTYAVGSRGRFTDKGMNLQGRFSVGTIEERRGTPGEEERWGFWSSPASHWPNSNGNAGQQGQTREVVAEGAKGAWLAKGGQVAESHWVAEDSLENWKQSLRALARLREDGQTGESSANYGRCTARKAPSRAPRNEPPASPARASAFDFKEAIRWSQCASQAENPRRSWDDRDLPRSIADLRDAIHARSRHPSSASPPPSPRPQSVVARLMGLDDLPKPSSEPPAPLINSRDRKSSGEAKLLQQLLQYSPPSPPPSTQPPSPTLHSLRRGPGHGARPTNVANSPTSTPQYGEPPKHSELQSMLKRLETMSLSGSIKTSNAKVFNTIPNNAKLHESTGHAGSWEETAEPLPLQSPVSKKKNSQQSLPVVVLKQSEEIRSHSPRSSDGFQDEIERRLRQLGLQSSEQERKTLKQILEAMQLKGLLKPPDSTKSSNGTKRQQASSPGSPRLSGNASPARTPSDGVIKSWPSPTSKSATRPYSSARPAKNDSNASASIVIMRPVAKSVSRVPAPVDDRQLGNEKATAPASRTEKLTPHKPKNTTNAEGNTLKQSGSGRPKSRSSTLTLPNTPVQTRKLSLKIKQGQVHLVKGSPRPASPEQARKSGSEYGATTRRQEHALCKASVKPLVSNTCEISPSSVPENLSVTEVNHAHSLDESIIHTVPDTSKLSDCLSNASGVSLDADTSHETGIGVVAVGTPPRELKADCNFGEKDVDCFSKEVIEQCSPVSVLDAHLSDEEAAASPKFIDATESIRVLTDFQVDSSSCGPLLGEMRFPPEAPKRTVAIQPNPLEMYSKAMVEDSTEEPCSNHADLLDASQEILQSALDNREQACASIVHLLCTEDALQDDMDCTSISTVDTTKDVAGVAMEGIMDEACASKQCLYIDVACGGNGDCLHVDSACKSNGDCMPMDDPCANTRDILHSMCESNGDYTDEVPSSNADYCYTEDVLRAAGLTGAWAGWECAANEWLAAGGAMPREVYEELEEQWDAVHAEEEGGHIEAEDRDMGGELYWKSQQASMRRRLVFDCLNQIVERHLSWLGLPGACGVGEKRHLPVSLVWGDLHRLQQGPCSAEDSMYAMLEQDLLGDADYSTPVCWRGMPTQFATVALCLEQEIFDSLLQEIFSQAEYLH